MNRKFVSIAAALAMLLQTAPALAVAAEEEPVPAPEPAEAVTLGVGTASVMEAEDETLESIDVSVGGYNLTLTAENYSGGKIYIAFYRADGSLSSVKAYDPSEDGVTAPVDNNAAYAKVLWWNAEMLPNCDTEDIEDLQNMYPITYRYDNNDNYLKSLHIVNPNQGAYFTDEGLVLQDIMVDGYNFLGWFTSQSGGDRVYSIPKGETGPKTLYAHWERLSYTVNFASEMAPQDDMTYYTGQERTLPVPKLDKYTFVGWSDKDGNVWEDIPAGTTGDITLYANWASERNKAEPVDKLADPIICEDSDKGVILFAYEIGEIKNVPLFTTLNLQCVNGIISTTSQTKTREISSQQASSIAQTVSNATTNSSSWTLSNDWNNSTEVSQSYLDQTGQTREEAETLSKSDTDTYNLSTSFGDTKTTTESGTMAHKLSMNNGHTTTSSTESGQNFELSVDAGYQNETSASVKAGIPGLGDATVGTKNTFEVGVGADYGNYVKNTATGTDSWSKNNESSLSYTATGTDTKSWNTSAGYSSSSTTSHSSSVSNAISKVVSEQYGYGQSYSEGGSNSESQALASTDTKSDEFSSTVTYYTSEIETTTTEFQSTGNTVGNYRMVMAGTIHVFAIVGYDVAEKTYFVYTYNILDDKTDEYLDYSYDGTFNDYETSIIPFEIPYFVSEYVNNRVAYTQGLMLDPDTGMIVDYMPQTDEPVEVVVIPSYMSVDNNDGTFDAVKVTGIAPGLFKDNKDIKAVQLGNFINEIPDSAFEGCSSLQYVLSPGVTRIGDRAFSGCTSLGGFTLPEDIESLGVSAFEGVGSISVTASGADVAVNAAASGAENIVLDISAIPEEQAEGMAIEIGAAKSFELQGKNREYKNLSVKSAAETTVINGVSFTENTGVPIELSSANVTLDRVTVDCGGYAMVLGADNTNIRLNRTVNLMSTGENAVISRNVSLAPLSAGIVGKLNITGNMLVSGKVEGDRYISFTNGTIIYIDDSQYENYLSSHTVYFDPGDGKVDTASKRVPMNTAIGELPTPARDFHTFDGWYTEPDGGERVTEDTVMTATGDITLYARWRENSVSDWTLSSDVPAGAEVVSEKWVYDLTSHTTSDSPSLSGWELENTDKKEGDWSAWLDTQPAAAEGRTIESQWKDTSYTVHEYHYYAWVTTSKDMWTTKAVAQKNTGKTAYLNEIWVTSKLPYLKTVSGLKVYKGPAGKFGNTNYFVADGTAGGLKTPERDRKVSDGHTQWRYKDTIYTYYYKKTETKEAFTDPTGQENVSNVKKYVQYRTK